MIVGYAGDKPVIMPTRTESEKQIILSKLNECRAILRGKTQEQVSTEAAQQARELSDLQRRIAMSCKLSEKRQAA